LFAAQEAGFLRFLLSRLLGDEKHLNKQLKLMAAATKNAAPRFAHFSFIFKWKLIKTEHDNKEEEEEDWNDDCVQFVKLNFLCVSCFPNLHSHSRRKNYNKKQFRHGRSDEKKDNKTSKREEGKSMFYDNRHTQL